MKITCLRHGQSEYNLLGLCNDEPARCVKLTETGRVQAARAARELANQGIEQIYCSPLPRTRETAEIINQLLAVDLRIHDELRDIISGFDGKPVKDYFAAIEHDRLNARVNGGESLLDHKQRILGFLDWLKNRDHEHTLLVAHEETLRVFHASHQGLDDLAMIDLHFDNCVPFSFEL